jgi:hypothetical protein
MTETKAIFETWKHFAGLNARLEDLEDLISDDNGSDLERIRFEVVRLASWFYDLYAEEVDSVQEQSNV